MEAVAPAGGRGEEDVMKRGIALAIACLLVAPIVGANDKPATTRAAAKVKIVIVGDSTVMDMVGWGRGFKERLSDDVECVNLGEGSKSSKSYRAEGFWDRAMAQRGDYVLIQFGHADQPGGRPDRETDAATEFRANMKRYAEDVRAAGGKAILVTPLVRRIWGEDGKIRDTLGDYANGTRAAAEDAQAPLIDLHARSIALCNERGPERCKAFDLPKSASHVNLEGSRVFGALVAEDLARVVPELVPHIKAAK
jgi:pectinesterase